MVIIYSNSGNFSLMLLIILQKFVLEIKRCNSCDLIPEFCGFHLDLNSGSKVLKIVSLLSISVRNSAKRFYLQASRPKLCTLL
jgi:hypothetical protein